MTRASQGPAGDSHDSLGAFGDLGRADRLAHAIGRPRRILECRTCFDFGMIESGRGEDVCPTCEGGVWIERESWRWYIHRQPWLGFRVLFFGSGLPTITRERPV